MTWWIVILTILGIYVSGWFVTALAITQIGIVQRGCAPGCKLQLNPRHDRYYRDDEPKFVGTHSPLCNKPHFELVTAGDAALGALVWPYLWFYGVLAVSEKKAHERQERALKAQAKAANPLTPEKLAEIDKVLENTDLVVSDDGKIVKLKELES